MLPTHLNHAVKDTSGSIELVGVLTDVAAAKCSEEQLSKTQAELAHIMCMTTLGELTASIAYEVNRPLAAVVTAAETCQRWLNCGTLNLDKTRRAVELIAQESMRVGEVVRRVHALASNAATKKAPLHINNVIEEVVPLVRHEILTHDVSLRLELGSALPPVLGDRAELQQVIINLVMNGIQAMNATTGRHRELLIRSREHGAGQILVEIEDSGSGVEPGNIDQLFNAFFTTKPNGLGLGLAICRSIIDRHDGRIWVAPNSGGTTFQFTLPALGTPQLVQPEAEIRASAASPLGDH
jgi:C4-dicarboxylate-specific signal transduction histidine kinase